MASLVLLTQWLFLLTVAILPLDVYFTLPAQQSGVFLSQVLTVEAAAMLIVTFLAGRMLGRATGLRLTRRDLLPLGLVAAAASLSVIFATSHAEALKGWLKVLGFFAIFVLARAFRDMRGVRRHALWLMLTGFFIVLVSGLLGYTAGLSDIPGVLLNIHRSPAAIPYSTILRAESTFRYPNELAAYLLIILPLLLASIVSYRQWVERSAGIVILILGVYLLGMTYTRSALVAFAVTLPILLYLLAGRRLAMVGGAAVAVGASLVAIRGGATSSHIFSIFSLRTAGYSERILAWQWAWDTFIHHPLFGVGIGNLTLQSNAPIVNKALGLREIDAENLMLNVLAEMGIFGLGAVLYCYAGALRLLWHARQASTTWIDRAWNNGLFVALCGLLIFGLSDPVLVSGQITGLLCAAVGLAGALPTDEAISDAPRQVTMAARLTALNGQIAATQGVPPLQSRIVFLVNAPHYGSVQRHSVNLAAELQGRGARVLVVVPPRSPLLPLLESHNIPCLSLDLGMSIGPGWDFLGIVASLNPAGRLRTSESLHALAQGEPVIFVCPCLREQLLVTSEIMPPDSRVVWVLHSTPAFWPQRVLLRRQWAKRAVEANAVVAVSRRVAQEAARLGLLPKRVEILPGPGHESLPGENSAVERIPNLLVAVAPLTEAQGIQYLIGALPRVIQRHPNARLAIAGSGPYELELQRQVHELGLEHLVKFLGDTFEPWRLLRQASLFVYPSVDPAEALPAIISEALAAGTPVVASSIGSIPDIVADRKTGLLAWPGDVASIASAIVALLDDPASAQAMGHAGRRMAQYPLTSTNANERFLQLLVDVETGWHAEEMNPSTFTAMHREGQGRLMDRERWQPREERKP